MNLTPRVREKHAPLPPTATDRHWGAGQEGVVLSLWEFRTGGLLIVAEIDSPQKVLIIESFVSAESFFVILFEFDRQKCFFPLHSRHGFQNTYRVDSLHCSG